MNEVGLKDQCFGVEVELTGITREQAAQALADYFGTEPRRGDDYYDSWYVRDGEGKEWRLMSDSSIRGEHKVGARYTSTSDPRYRVEMVTPKLTYAELPKFQECVRRVRTAGGKVNSSCGIHIHVDAVNHNRQSLKISSGSCTPKRIFCSRHCRSMSLGPPGGVRRYGNPCCKRHASFHPKKPKT